MFAQLFQYRSYTRLDRPPPVALPSNRRKTYALVSAAIVLPLAAVVTYLLKSQNDFSTWLPEVKVGTSGAVSEDNLAIILKDTLLPVDENGCFFAVNGMIASRKVITSAGGTHKLELKPNGELVLYENTHTGEHAIWWTGTGFGSQWLEGSSHRVAMEINTSGHSRLVVQTVFGEDFRTVWHSDMKPSCKKDSNPEGWTQDRNDTVQLRLSPSGRLAIDGLCDLHVPLADREKNRSLAVIVAGLYRSNHVACLTHMKTIIASHPNFTRIDVFAHILYEPADLDKYGRTPESIEADVRRCYATALKTVTVIHVHDAEKATPYPGGIDAMKQTPCGPKLGRLHAQLNTIHEAANDYWAWTVQEGFLHDTVLRIRPDMLFRDKVYPNFLSLTDVGDSTIVLPHSWGPGGHYYYCSKVDGSVGVGTTDQVAYGSPEAMRPFLHMWTDFPRLIDLAAGPARPAYRDISGCEALPSGPKPSDCPESAPCSIECILAWYLSSKGVKFRVEWSWRQSLLRMWDVDKDKDAIEAVSDAQSGIEIGFL